MKKIFMALILCLFSIMCFGQLSIKTVEESRGYVTVYTAPMGYGEIRFCRGAFILFGESDNHYELTMNSIYLGNDKESSILSLEDLRKIVKRETKLTGDIVVIGANGRNTTISRSVNRIIHKTGDGVGGWPYLWGAMRNEIIFKTDGVAGWSHLLWAMRNDFENAKNAIRNFNIEN